MLAGADAAITWAIGGGQDSDTISDLPPLSSWSGPAAVFSSEESLPLLRPPSKVGGLTQGDDSGSENMGRFESSDGAGDGPGHVRFGALSTRCLQFWLRRTLCGDIRER